MHKVAAQMNGPYTIGKNHYEIMSSADVNSHFVTYQDQGFTAHEHVLFHILAN